MYTILHPKTFFLGITTYGICFTSIACISVAGLGTSLLTETFSREQCRRSMS